MRYLIALIFMALAATTHAGACDSLRTQMEENECANEGYQQADQTLNRIYSAYQKRLQPTQRARLKAAQVAWIRFRDANCAFESSGVEGGSAHTLIYLNCMAATTAERSKALQALAACKEGDLSCPAPEAAAAQ